MGFRTAVATLLATLVVAACGDSVPRGPAENTWVGSITTDGDVTTVVNGSGSVWGGAATLVEELSIGVESGAPEYMFGQIAWVHVDKRGIWVADEQTPAVRLFDFDGNHVLDFGGEGEGPGEYTRPQLIATAADGRVFVADGGSRRINVYAPDGEFLEVLRIDRGVAWGGYIPMAIDAQGRPWLVYRDYDLLDPAARSKPTFFVQAHSVDGRVGERRQIPTGEVAEPRQGRTRYHPAWQWNFTPTGDLLFGGSDDYRFERRSPDGTALRIRMHWDPVAISQGEIDYLNHLAVLRGDRGGNAADYPDHKAAFLGLLGGYTGETWVLRQGPGFQVPGCDDRPTSMEEVLGSMPCWQDAYFFDVFGTDGRYLGRVDVLDEWRDTLLLDARVPHLMRDHVTAAASDEQGTIVVRRYRLVPPGE